ncbi:hypothetical protein [Novosphingobium naphthalenivorans]|uniref:hypothetical protein n=1 Tax=Novosphingobium naphthalenivorans TaxID=273168 RepID=UPI0008361A52|nr:hypothetical protein [Novosphingobium naphthalenivorans]
MKLETDRVTIDEVTIAQLREELGSLDGVDNTRAILSRGDEFYLQTACFDNGFVIEKREGSEADHFHAVPRHAPLPATRTPPKRGWLRRLFASSDFLTSECAFSKADMIRAFAAYYEGTEAQLPLEWKEGYCDR